MTDRSATLSDRSLGWLRYLHRKAHTPDDWSRAGRPHPHWDDRSDPPMAGRHRFDLVDSSYAVGLMAQRTPAWTEAYVAILDRLIERHTGWTATGIEPQGAQQDPVAEDGMLSSKGFFLVLLGIRSMVATAAGGPDRWNEAFEMLHDGDRSFTWTHSAIAEHLRRQWQASPRGRHGENTKVWPHRLAGAGLGLRLHDNRHGTDHAAAAFDPWWAHARAHDLDLAGDVAPTLTTMYSDPVVDHHRLPVGLAMTTAFYALPQHPDDARRLFDAACTAMRLDRDIELPITPSRDYGAALVMAKEWGLTDVVDRIQAAIEASFEPTWDGPTGEFTWGMGLDEPHPRGQFNAFLAAGEAAGFGRWTGLSAAPLERCPQVVGVDFPRVALTRAEWRNGALLLTVAPLRADPNAWTEFRIVGAEPRQWWLTGIDGATAETRTGGVLVRVPMVAGDLEFVPGSY